jgi:nucleotide-binding universal stress UspA family protein
MFRPRRLLVPVDLSPAAEKVVRAVAGLARDFGGRILLFHVFDTRAVEDVYNLHGLKEQEVRARMRANAGETMRRLLAKPWMKGLKVEVRLADGVPPEAILAAAREWKADLIVLTRRRRSGLAHLLYGRTSDAVVHEAPCAVLALPP